MSSYVKVLSHYCTSVTAFISSNRTISQSELSYILAVVRIIISVCRKQSNYLKSFKIFQIPGIFYLKRDATELTASVNTRLAISSLSATAMTLFFVLALPCVNSRATRSQVTMGRRRSFKKTPGPSPTPPEKRQELEKIAREFGVLPSQPGQDLDKQYGTAAPESSESESTLYTELAKLLGVDTLEKLELTTYFALGGLLTAFIALGLAISSAAFYKAVEKPIPDVLNTFLNNAEPLFTPTAVVFLILSSMLGIYKQSQLNSGVTGYSEGNDKGN